MLTADTNASIVPADAAIVYSVFMFHELGLPVDVKDVACLESVATSIGLIQDAHPKTSSHVNDLIMLA